MPAAELTDGELARRISDAGETPAGAEEAELCRRYGRRLVYFGRRRLGSEDAARDLAQDVLLVTLKKLRQGEVREVDKVGSFVLGVARRLADRRRGVASVTPHGEIAVDDLSGELVAESVRAPDPLAAARVVPCLEALPDRQRAVILLSFYAEQTSSEVAAALGLNAGNVRVMRHRGILRLRECLGLGAMEAST